MSTVPPDGAESTDSTEADESTGPGGDTAATSVRLTMARARVADAEKALAAATAAAADARRDRVRRGVRARSIVSLGAVVVTVALIATGVVLVVLDRHQRTDTARASDVLAAARSAITITLTADPSKPKDYVNSVLAVSTGEFRTRISSSAGEIESSVASQPLPGTGQVVSAGIVGADPTAGGGADVLLVAEATNPQLLGGGAGDARVVLLVRMARADGAWKIAQAQLQ